MNVCTSHDYQDWMELGMSYHSMDTCNGSRDVSYDLEEASRMGSASNNENIGSLVLEQKNY